MGAARATALGRLLSITVVAAAVAGACGSGAAVTTSTWSDSGDPTPPAGDLRADASLIALQTVFDESLPPLADRSASATAASTAVPPPAKTPAPRTTPRPSPSPAARVTARPTAKASPASNRSASPTAGSTASGSHVIASPDELRAQVQQLAAEPLTAGAAQLAKSGIALTPAPTPLPGSPQAVPSPSTISGSGLRSTASSVRFYFDHLSSPGAIETDANGIPVVRYNGVPQYNPVTISQQALAYYGIWANTGDRAAWGKFILYTNWLVANQKPDGIWEYTFAFGPQPVPWWSAMAEGQAASALVRAYRETRDPKYRTAAYLALGTFNRPQSSRGVTLVDNGYSWYEEYMPPYSPHTLNGFMFALAGVRDVYLTFGDPLSQKLWNDGLATLVHDLPRFDPGYWSCYSLYWPNLTGCNLATLGYHQVHIYELQTYYRWTGLPIFKTYADRFTQYLASPPPSV